MRMIALLLLVIDLLAGAATGIWAGAEFWFFVLIAEYAATIRTIPPLAAKRSAPAAAESG
jgi:ABC-type proline/glycine betaine transport system permease subunit